jgi:hypothetical protein
MSVLSLLAISITPAVAGPTGPNLAIPDGEWEGSVAAYYLWDIQGMATGVWTWGGDMHFFSSAGELTGESAITGTGSGETDSAMAIGTVNAQVAIFGSSFAPEFQATSGVFSITAASQGFSTNMDFPIDTSQTVPVKVTLTTVTCSQVTGDFDAFMNSMASSVGGTLTNLSTLFAAVRTADLAPEAASDFQDSLNELVGMANDFLSEVKSTQSLDQNKFEHILTTAEQLALSLRKNNDCGFTNNWTFSLPIANLVAELIDFAYNNPGYFTNLDVFKLTETAIRAGVIGAGAVNPELDTEMRTKLGALIGVKMDELDSAGGNCQALMPLWIAANTVGGAAQTQAGTLYTKYGC